MGGFSKVIWKGGRKERGGAHHAKGEHGTKAKDNAISPTNI
jgi:hypothetical protein